MPEKQHGSEDKYRQTEAAEREKRRQGRLPGLKPDLFSIYQGMRRIGATDAASARPIQEISKALDLPKNRAQKALEELEGKGVVGHITKADTTNWFTRR